MTFDTAETLQTRGGPGWPRSPRVVGLLIAGALSVLVLYLFLAIGLAGDGRGNTFEGFPYDELVLTIGLLVALPLGWWAGPKVTATSRPIRWMIGLALVAPPLGGLVFMALTGIQTVASDGDFSRWITWMPLAVIWSYLIALPATIVVSVTGTFLVRSWRARPMALTMITLAMAVAAVLIGAGALADTLGTFGLGPGARQPIPTQAVSPPFPRDQAIAAAEPYATELSLTPAAFESADAYDMADLCVKDGPTGPSFECEYDGLAWLVRFSITNPDGQAGSVDVALDGDTGALMYTSQ